MDNNYNNPSDTDIDYILTESFVKIHNYAFFDLKPILSTKPYKKIRSETSIIDEPIEEHIINVKV